MNLLSVGNGLLGRRRSRRGGRRLDFRAAWVRPPPYALHAIGLSDELAGVRRELSAFRRAAAAPCFGPVEWEATTTHTVFKPTNAQRVRCVYDNTTD